MYKVTASSLAGVMFKGIYTKFSKLKTKRKKAYQYELLVSTSIYGAKQDKSYGEEHC